MGCIYFETVLNDFVSQKVVMQKEHNIIISRVICSHTGSLFVETPYIYIYIYVCVCVCVCMYVCVCVCEWMI